MSQATAGTAHGLQHGSLTGRWHVVYQEIDGEAIKSDDSSTILELHENEFKIEQNNAVTYEGSFTLRPGEPAEIVLLYRKSKNSLFLGGPRAGIVQVEGDTLKFNFAGVGHSAPKSFNTFPGAESVLSVYRRESKGAKAVSVSSLHISALKSVALW